MIKKISLLLLILLSILHIPFAKAHDNVEHTTKSVITKTLQQVHDATATIFYNEACGMCAKYVNDEMPIMFENQGISDIIKKDYVNVKNNRAEMNALMTQFDIPLELQSHIMTFVDMPNESKTYILGGHIPNHIINDLFKKENFDKLKRIIVFQDKMHGDVENYEVLGMPMGVNTYMGEIKTYHINSSISEYINELNNTKTTNKKNEVIKKTLLPTILISGFLDGLNPCAFAVLLLFIAFLFSIKRGKKDVWKMGAVYIGAIYLAYLLIGFGILKAVMFSNAPHFMAKLGAWLVIALGAINLINYFYKKFPIKLRIPHTSKETLQKYMHQATLPAAFIMGFLVGLCTFPCSGGIYVAIIGLLVAKTTYWTGVNYLLLYNVAFVLPLVIILLITANPYAVVKVGKWQQKNKKTERLIMGIVMIALGIIILTFFI